MPGEFARIGRGGIEACCVLQDGAAPELVHVGRPLGVMGRGLVDDLVAPSGLDSPARPTLVTEPGRGWHGEPGIVVSRGGLEISPVFRVASHRVDADTLECILIDEQEDVELVVRAIVDTSGVLVLTAVVSNRGDRPLGVDSLLLTIPVPDHLSELVTLGGRHAMEFVERRTPWDRTVVRVESRRGRTSHQTSPTVFLVSPHTSNDSGDAWGVHVAWSGNHRLVCDAVNADRRTVTAGELLGPGEVVLGPGDSYSTPEVVVAVGDSGINSVSDAFHRRVRSIVPTRVANRPVIVNTWEAVYFRHDETTLLDLAARAARVGAERFVLDDGWFLGRRDDTAGLGDWEIDTSVWPDGLLPLARGVRDLGMDFGIWVEPEMVNPDSRLYREHPDWVLGPARRHDLVGRNQLVLDLSRDDVRDHLVGVLDALLSSLPMDHVKWDHNRDIVASGAHRQALGHLEVLSALRDRHPGVDFESCASGGGRIDMATMRHATRFWTSDSIDALDRLTIQRGALRVMPPEVLGAHIGAPVCHTTGRRHPLSFRALSALPFWMGIEWDLLSATDHELDRLAEVVAIHKRHRDLFHSGVTRLCDHPDSEIHVHAVLASDRSEALVVVAAHSSVPAHRRAPIRIPDLDSVATYRCALVHLGTPRWALHRGLPSWVENGVEATGAQLAVIGLPMPPLLPESGVLVHVERVS